MSDITLRQLRYLDALARHGHFGRAADVSAISQPALSAQIRALEARLGAPLLERGAFGARLTVLGVEVVDRARAVLRAVDDLADLGRTGRDGLSGRLRLGIIPTIAPYLLPRILEGIGGLWPALAIDLSETTTTRLLAGLGEGRLDTAILALPVSEPGLVERPLFSERFVLVRPEAAAGDPVPAAERLREMRLLLLEEGHCFRDQALAFCDLRRPRARHALDASSLSTLVQMVGAGLGVTLIPEMAVAVETRSARVATARLPEPQPTRTVGMVWRETSPLAGPFAALAARLAEALAPSAEGIGGAG